MADDLVHPCVRARFRVCARAGGDWPRRLSNGVRAEVAWRAIGRGVPALLWGIKLGHGNDPGNEWKCQNGRSDG